MLSVMEVKKRLPRDFIEELYSLHSPLVADKILSQEWQEKEILLCV